MKRILFGLMFVLVSCGQPEQAPKKVVGPTFNPAWLPSAKGVGNLLVCLDKDTSPQDLQRVTMPPRLLFQSWGPVRGSLRDKASIDPQALQTGPAANALTSYAVMTLGSLTVSQNEPCVRVKVRAVTNAGFRWTHDFVPGNLHYNFEVENLEVTPQLRLGAATKLPDGSAVKQVLLNGALLVTPVASIGDPATLTELE